MLQVQTALLAIALLQPVSTDFRPPAVPLIAHDPYFSVWSTSDRLAETNTRHWTGAEQPLTSLIRIDGKPFRLMGKSPSSVPELEQTGLAVGPTRTVYSFTGAGTEVHLTFTSPLLPEDIDVLSRPVTYISWDVRSTDHQAHEVEVYFDANAKLAVNVPTQKVVWRHFHAGSMTALSIESEDQPVLQKRGDDLRIDWGRLLVAATGKGSLGKANARAFAATGGLMSNLNSTPTPASEDVTASVVVSLGKVGEASVSGHVVVAYDDEYSIKFMGHNLRPYWRRNGMDSKGLLEAAERDYARLTARCEAFDQELISDLEKAGGADYAKIASLAYRQSFAAQKVVADAKGQPLMFSKENFSNGCISTVDVLYPAAPQLLLFSPTLTKASLVPILEYAASDRWKWPFAPHDLGQYPKANGQVYGGGEHTEENQMPVEESGNMLILLAALAKEEGNATFSAKYWPQLSKWAAYLADKGFDPESQLSTDDFAGHLAHNVNLSAKAIEALGAYAYLAEQLGKKDEAAKYRELAKGFAERWVREAKEGDHYRLAFDQAGTWSQKYNLVWDRLLGLNLFPTDVATEELAFYRTKINPYGLPLDSRKDYTKLDWEVWTATLTGNREDFESIVSPIAKFLNDTGKRVPMSDFYDTSTPTIEGFQARSVVGGVFIKMLDTPMWSKYVARDRAKVGPWAGLPTPPVVTEIVPTAITRGAEWSYTFDKPAEGWSGVAFDDTAWKRGLAGFGKGDARGGAIQTPWLSDDVWIRRQFDLPATSIKDLQLSVAHDDGAEVYINGLLVVQLPNAAGYESYELSKAVRDSLKPTHNTIAIHCHDDGGDKYIDAGFVTVKLAK